MENQKKKKKKNFFFFFFVNWEFFVWNWEKNILFGIGNGAEFRPQNRVIESPGYYFTSISFSKKLAIFQHLTKVGCCVLTKKTKSTAAI